MKRAILGLMVLSVLGAALALGGCSTLADMRYPLPQPEGAKRQLNKGQWVWPGA
jgi:hypothetical protein